ncbi:hypothetical protein FQN57_003888 [Myotisia sp. PD_48]|nr:hypothetical protein FQN57_003888 [Myotisia sp. PD_48]
MPLQARWNLAIPNIGLPDLLFTSPSRPQSKTERLFIDAARPDTHYFTIHEFALWCKRFAAGLQKAGLQQGDRVFFFSPNDLFFPVVIIGTIMAGGIFTGANPSYTPREVAYQVQDCSAKFVISAEAGLDTVIAGVESLGMSRDKVYLFSGDVFDGKGQGKSGCRYWGDLIASREEGELFSWESGSSEEFLNRTISLNYSSGTTGVPKGVEITHRNWVSNILQFNFLATLRSDYEEREKHTKWLLFLPMYHAMAQNFVCASLLRKVPMYIMNKFDFPKMLENIEKFRISDLKMVPPIAVMVAKSPLVKNYDLSSIRSLGSGAAPLGIEVSQELETLFQKNELYVRQGWGMTEVTCSLLGWDPSLKGSNASVGELNPNCEAKIMDEEGIRELGRNQRGELWVKGPNVMKGYWGKPKETQETMTEDGWLKSGDIAYVDETGKFYIVDRKKELIKVKGNQVAPAELEGVLLDHPAVADAAVIGVTLDGDECPRAYITLKEGKVATATDIIEYMKKNVAPTKRITGGVIFTDSIPKNPSGKILRKILRERAAKELQNEGKSSAKL